MVNHITPAYLSLLLPERLGLIRNTRGADIHNFRIPVARTESYRNSFIPSSILAWNNLSPRFKSATSKRSFKVMQRQISYHSIPKYYHLADRKMEIVLNKMRLGFCNLNYDLFSKGCIPSARCHCGYESETLHHYYLECPSHIAHRQLLLREISNIIPTGTPITHNLLIAGNVQYDFETNQNILLLTVSYILKGEDPTVT